MPPPSLSGALPAAILVPWSRSSRLPQSRRVARPRSPTTGAGRPPTTTVCSASSRFFASSCLPSTHAPFSYCILVAPPYSSQLPPGGSSHGRRAAKIVVRSEVSPTEEWWLADWLGMSMPVVVAEGYVLLNDDDDDESINPRLRASPLCLASKPTYPLLPPYPSFLSLCRNLRLPACLIASPVPGPPSPPWSLVSHHASSFLRGPIFSHAVYDCFFLAPTPFRSACRSDVFGDAYMHACIPWV